MTLKQLSSPKESALFELGQLDVLCNTKELEYAVDLMVLPQSSSCRSYNLPSEPEQSSSPPAAAGIIFIVGNYVGDEGVNEQAEQKLLAALKWVPDNIRGTMALYGCKPQCSVCESVFKKAIPRLNSHYRYPNCRAHEDKPDLYPHSANAQNIKALDVDKYFPE